MLENFSDLNRSPRLTAPQDFRLIQFSLGLDNQAEVWYGGWLHLTKEGLPANELGIPPARGTPE